MSKRLNLANCHPERKHLAKGLCGECYYRMRGQLPERKEQARAYQRERSQKPGEREKNTLRRKEWVITRRYGLSLTWFEETLLIGCAICGTLDWGDQGACIDHDHRCCPGEYGCPKCVRGLLCSSCNRMLGQAHDRSEILVKGAEYLRGWSDKLEP